MSYMSSLEDDSRESVKPTILFTNAEEKEEINTSDSEEKEETNTSDSYPQVESSTPQSAWWPIVLLLTFFGGCAACASCASSCFINIFKKFWQFIQSAGFMMFSFISSLMQAEKSAASCSTTQYILSILWWYVYSIWRLDCSHYSHHCGSTSMWNGSKCWIPRSSQRQQVTSHRTSNFPSDVVWSSTVTP